jgi:hypothetical protein
VPENEWERREWQGFAMGAITIQPGAMYTKREPARAASLESDVWVPSLQALLSGVFAGLAGGAVAHVITLDRAMFIGITTGAVCAGLVWAAQVRDHNRLLWKVEEIVGADVDGDGVVGEPPRPEVHEQLVLVHGAGRAPEQSLRRRFEEFVRGCERMGTAQNYWEQTRKLDRSEYLQWRDSLIRLGWGKWRSPGSPNQGWELIASADEVIAGMFREPPHPTQERM